MDRKQREAELHEILTRPGGNDELISIWKKYAKVGVELTGTPLVEEILGYEFPPDRTKALGDIKFDDPPGTEAPGG